METKQLPKDREYRYVSTPELVTETRGEKQVRMVRGMAVKFGELSRNLGWFREKFERGAFDNVLENDVVALFNHNIDKVLARTISKTLRIWQDDQALWYEFEVPDNTVGNDLAVSMQRGDIQHSSFAFMIGAGGEAWNEDEDLGTVRTVLKGGVSRLYDVSPVVFPAYPQSTSELSKRSYDEWKQENTKPDIDEQDFRNDIFDAEMKLRYMSTLM
jgi:uncharacterized protein